MSKQIVWTLSASADGPEGGDWDGVSSVHATRKGAELAAFDFIYSLGVDPRDKSATLVTAHHKDKRQTCVELETSNGWTAHYGVHRMEVKP